MPPPPPPPPGPGLASSSGKALGTSMCDLCVTSPAATGPGGLPAPCQRVPAVSGVSWSHPWSTTGLSSPELGRGPAAPEFTLKTNLIPCSTEKSWGTPSSESSGVSLWGLSFGDVLLFSKLRSSST